MKSKITAIKLNRLSGSASSILTLGDVPESMTRNYEINYHQVPPNSDNLWSLKLDDILIDGASIGLCQNEK
jgi:hypothetical protein